MKILFISMPSIHAIRWIENLKGTNHEIYWFDVLDEGELNVSMKITKFTGWKKRKVIYIKGEFFLRKKMNRFYNFIEPLLEVTANEHLEILLKRIKPDLVHSFEMQSCCYPILKTMNKFPRIAWLYSCWGSDLFYYQNIKSHLPKIKEVLKRIDFLHTDCQRDGDLSRLLGFGGRHLAVVPGGSGYNIESLSSNVFPVKKRKIVLVKGYEHHVGRGLNCVKALEIIREDIEKKGLNVVVFGAHAKVANYIEEKKLPFLCYKNRDLPHEKLLNLMGQSLIYLGNSLSDGIPNTLLEAIIMGAFPIQSNPGGATAEIIKNGENGFLIENPEDVIMIRNLIKEALESQYVIENAFLLNQKIAQKDLDYASNRDKIKEIYNVIENI